MGNLYLLRYDVIRVQYTVDGEHGGFGQTSRGDILRDARVVGGITESYLTDEQVARVRYDHVHVSASVHTLSVTQPVHLNQRQQVNRRQRTSTTRR